MLHIADQPRLLGIDLQELSPADRLAHDIEQTAKVSARLERHIRTGRGHILAMLSAAQGSLPLLKPTITRLIDQCRESRVIPHIMIGLDKGMELPFETFAACADVDGLHLREKLRPNNRAVIHENSTEVQGVLQRWLMEDRDPSILTVAQSPKASYSGKLHMLRDMTDILVRRGYGLPEILLLLDAESRFVRTSPSVVEPDMQSDGFSPWLDTVENAPNQSLIGMRMRVVPFSADEMGDEHPDFDLPLSAHHHAGNVLREVHQGTDMAGGGMGGRTKDVLALLATIAQYRVRAEDTAMTRLAQASGWHIETQHESTLLNRSPSAWQLGAAMKQIARWNSSIESLRKLYGDIPGSDSAESSTGKWKRRTKNVITNPIHASRIALEKVLIGWYKSGIKECPFNGEAHW